MAAGKEDAQAQMFFAWCDHAWEQAAGMLSMQYNLIQVVQNLLKGGAKFKEADDFNPTLLGGSTSGSNDDDDYPWAGVEVVGNGE